MLPRKFASVFRRGSDSGERSGDKSCVPFWRAIERPLE
jgi:hypothetical protein